MSAVSDTSPRQRLWLTGGALAALLLVVIGYFALIGPQRADTASVRSRVADTSSANTVLEARVTALRAQNAHLSTFTAQAAAARAALPADSGMSSFIRALQTLGARTHTDAVNVTFGTPTDVTAQANSTPGTATGAPATGTATPAAPAPATAAAPTTPGVYGLPVTAQVNGSPNALTQFLTQLQQVQPRAVLITGIVQGTGAGDTGAPRATTGSTLQLTMLAFMAPKPAPTASHAGH